MVRPIADLAVVNIDESGGRRLRVYAFGEESWVPALDATLRRGTSFVDVAEIGGRDRLITYGRGRLKWFDPESGAERELVAAACDFSPPAETKSPMWTSRGT